MVTTQHGWSRRDLLLVVASGYLLFVAIVAIAGSYTQRVLATGDNRSYALEAAVIRGANPSILDDRPLLGYPLLTVPVASVFRVSDTTSLVVVSTIASLAAVALAAVLWGPWAAACFALLNVDWIQRSLLGGPESTAAALLFAALWFIRRERWVTAAALAALATVTRPLSVVVLVAVWLVLLKRRQARDLSATVAVSCAIIGAYFVLARAVFGDPLANVSYYVDYGVGIDRTFIPFVTIFSAGHALTAKAMLKTLVLMCFTAAAVVAVLKEADARASIAAHPVEWLFGALYLAALCLCPARLVDADYARYLVPVVPLGLLAMSRWLPHKRWIVWSAGLAIVVLAAVEDTPAFNRAFDLVLAALGARLG